MDRSEEICLAISTGALARLLSEQQLSAEDFRCLTPTAKRLVRALVLDNLRASRKRAAIKKIQLTTNEYNDNLSKQRLQQDAHGLQSPPHYYPID